MKSPLALIRRRRRSRVPAPLSRAGDTLAEAPRWQQAAALAVPAVAIALLAYAGRRRLFQAAALAAEAVEEVADTVEDFAEDVGEAARAKAAGDERPE